MRTMFVAAVIVAGLAQLSVTAQAPVPTERKLQLSFDGRGSVTLLAQNVTLREILAEWTRLGGCQFVNAERLPAEPLLLQFDNESEVTVLNSLLRRAAGVIISPRTTRTAGASRFELVQILPTSSPIALGSFTPNVTPAPLTTQGSPDDEIPPVRPANPNAPPAAAQPAPNRPTMPTVGIPGQGVFVPIQAVPPPGTPATAGTPTPTTPPATGRGGGGGGR